MKKYLFGLFAIALAIGFSAFTTLAKKEKTTGSGHTFKFLLNASPTSANVVNDRANWITDDNLKDVAATCGDAMYDYEPCAIIVDEDDTQGSGSSRSLKSTVSITEGTNYTNHYYVVSIASTYPAVDEFQNLPLP